VILNLNYNKLKTLTKQVENFKNLEELSLRSNDFTNIPGAVLELEKLRRLDMSNNRLTHVHPLLCSRLLFLETLLLNNNNILYFPLKLFSELKNSPFLSSRGFVSSKRKFRCSVFLEGNPLSDAKSFETTKMGNIGNNSLTTTPLFSPESPPFSPVIPSLLSLATKQILQNKGNFQRELIREWTKNSCLCDFCGQKYKQATYSHFSTDWSCFDCDLLIVGGSTCSQGCARNFHSLLLTERAHAELMGWKEKPSIGL